MPFEFRFLSCKLKIKQKGVHKMHKCEELRIYICFESKVQETVYYLRLRQPTIFSYGWLLLEVWNTITLRNPEVKGNLKIMQGQAAQN